MMKCNGHCDDPPTLFFLETFRNDQKHLWAYCADCVENHDLTDCTEIEADEALVFEVMER